MKNSLHGLAFCSLLSLFQVTDAQSTAIQVTELETKPVHLRSGQKREWTRFPEKAAGQHWSKRFRTNIGKEAKTLLIRQDDVRRDWEVKLNGRRLGKLKKDQNALIHHFVVLPDQLVDEENVLSISGLDSKNSDDIRVGPITLVDAKPETFFRQCHLHVTVKDLDTPDLSLPCRVTILDSHGSLVSLAARSNDRIAVREGVVYTRDGVVKTGLPPGTYQLFVNRGFEYSQASATIKLAAGETKKVKLALRRVVDTKGLVSCDTHVHTLTHSGHGDCSITERMITLAGEAVELPVATDHNKQIDYREIARKTKTESFFTPLIGNEVTTNFGHFNAFPFAGPSPVPDHRLDDWNQLLPSIYKLGAKVAILNHARDIHRGYRPFDPANFNQATGQSLNGRPFRFNAMEVINSAAQQTDQFQLFRDWMALINGGHRIIPIGSSDSHDVNAFIVGQGRTYIGTRDDKPGRIEVDKAMEAMLKGRVSVSCGLLAKLKVNGKSGPGDLVKPSDRITVHCQMLGPHWLTGTRMQLFENGILVGDKKFEPGKVPSGEGFVHETVFRLNPKKHDSFLVLLVTGPGFMHPSWRLSQPYQPTGPDWDPKIFGFTGATFVDADGDGKFRSARSYAKELVSRNPGNLEELVRSLAGFDSSVACQAAGLFHSERDNLFEDENAKIWRSGPESIREGFVEFLDAWRISEQAKVLR